MWKIIKAEFLDLPDILCLQKIAYQSEAELNHDYSIPPLLQEIEQLQEEYKVGTVFKAVEEDSNTIIGSVRGFTKDNTLYIGKLIVHPDHQNKGMGKQLLRQLENCFPGYRYELFTSVNSEKNLALYQKEGYRQFRTQKVGKNLELIFLEKGC